MSNNFLWNYGWPMISYVLIPILCGLVALSLVWVLDLITNLLPEGNKWKAFLMQKKKKWTPIWIGERIEWAIAILLAMFLIAITITYS